MTGAKVGVGMDDWKPSIHCCCYVSGWRWALRGCQIILILIRVHPKWLQLRHSAATYFKPCQERCFCRTATNTRTSSHNAIKQSGTIVFFVLRDDWWLAVPTKKCLTCRARCFSVSMPSVCNTLLSRLSETSDSLQCYLKHFIFCFLPFSMCYSLCAV